MSCTAGVTNPSAVPRHVTIAGSQIRLGRTRPALPMGRGVNSSAEAREESITPGESALVVFFFVVVGMPRDRILVELVLDPVLGQAMLEGQEARLVAGAALTDGLQELLQPRHASGQLAHGLEADDRLALLELLEGARVPVRAE